MGCQADGLRGVGLYESSDFNGISVSMAGGGLLNIAAQTNAFDGAAIQNTLSFETDDLTGWSMNFDLPRLSGKFIGSSHFFGSIGLFYIICLQSNFVILFYS